MSAVVVDLCASVNAAQYQRAWMLLIGHHSPYHYDAISAGIW